MNSYQVWKRFINGVIALVVVGCGMAQVAQPMVDTLDREMGSAMLGSVAQGAVGTLVEDGEGVCDRLPLSACGYKSGQYTYYFSDGVLVSKSLNLLSEKDVGPWGIRWGDTKQDIVKKLIPYVGSVEPVTTENVIFYPLDCSPRLCRLDIQFSGGAIESLRFYYSDAT